MATVTPTFLRDLKTREAATVAGLVLFVAVFLGAIWLRQPDRDVNLEVRAIGAYAAKARDCGVPERAIGKFVEKRLRDVRERYPGLGTSELVAMLLEPTRTSDRNTPSHGDCDRILSLVAGAP